MSRSSGSKFADRMVSLVNKGWDEFISRPSLFSSRRTDYQAQRKQGQCAAKERMRLLEKQVRELATRIEQRRAAHQTSSSASDLAFADQIMTELYHNRGRGDSFFTYDGYSGAHPTERLVIEIGGWSMRAAPEESNYAERDPRWEDFRNGHIVTHGFRRIGGHPDFEITAGLPARAASRFFTYFFARVKAGQVFKDGDVMFIGCGRGASQYACAEDCTTVTNKRVPSTCGGVMVKLVRYCFADNLRIIFADARQEFTMDAPQISYCPVATPVSYNACTCQD